MCGELQFGLGIKAVKVEGNYNCDYSNFHFTATWCYFYYWLKIEHRNGRRGVDAAGGRFSIIWDKANPLGDEIDNAHHFRPSCICANERTDGRIVVIIWPQLIIGLFFSPPRPSLQSELRPVNARRLWTCSTRHFAMRPSLLYSVDRDFQPGKTRSTPDPWTV